MKKSISKIIVIASILLIQSCSSFVDDCKSVINDMKNKKSGTISVKVEPPKGCSENEFL